MDNTATEVRLYVSGLRWNRFSYASRGKIKKPPYQRARQVGKTWLMRKFGKTAYTETVYVIFDNNSRMQTLFEGNLSTERIITDLELYARRKISAVSTMPFVLL